MANTAKSSTGEPDNEFIRILTTAVAESTIAGIIIFLSGFYRFIKIVAIKLKKRLIIHVIIRYWKSRTTE